MVISRLAKGWGSLPTVLAAGRDRLPAAFLYPLQAIPLLENFCHRELYVDQPDANNTFLV